MVVTYGSNIRFLASLDVVCVKERVKCSLNVDCGTRCRIIENIMVN
jgi:hypothetical protein